VSEPLDLEPIKPMHDRWAQTPVDGDARNIAYAAVMSLPKLIAEVERYRSLLQRLNTTTVGAPLCLITCDWCGNYTNCDTEPHDEGCPWIEVLREVKP
jgi:hypothetical protein